jgi:hypothetical protein
MSLEWLKDKLNLTISFAGLIVCVYFAWTWYIRHVEAEIIANRNGSYEVSIDKELSVTVKKVGYHVDEKGVSRDDFYRIACVRASLEDKVSGKIHLEYYIVNTTEGHKGAIKVSEDYAASCVNNSWDGAVRDVLW